MAISRILSSAVADAMIIYLIPPARDARSRRSKTVMRRYPRVDGPAVLPLFCLAPHGVFRASQITPRAVSSYLAFSTLPVLCCQRTGGVFSVTLSVTAISQLRRPRVFRGMLPYGVRTFLSELLRSDHLPSRGIYHRLEKQKEGMNLEARKTRRETKPQKSDSRKIRGFLVSRFV